MWGGTGWEEREEPERAEDGQARPGGRERCQGGGGHGPRHSWWLPGAQAGLRDLAGRSRIKLFYLRHLE